MADSHTAPVAPGWLVAWLDRLDPELLDDVERLLSGIEGGLTGLARSSGVRQTELIAAGKAREELGREELAREFGRHSGLIEAFDYVESLARAVKARRDREVDYQAASDVEDDQ